MMYKTGHEFLSHDIINNICMTLNCEADEINNIEPMKVGLTNLSFRFTTPTGNYVYRAPGKGTDSFINRKSEAFSESVAKKLLLDTSIIHIDEFDGWKISRYIENYRYIDPLNRNDQKEAMQLLYRLHHCGIVSPWNFDYEAETEKIASLPGFVSNVDFSQYYETHQKILTLSRNLKANGHKTVLCHNDAWHWNMLKSTDGTITLIDWEYSGNSYPEADVAYFTASLPFSDDEYISLAELYEGHSLSEVEKSNYFSVMAIVLWYWFVWALYEEHMGTLVEDKELWKTKAVHAMKIAIKLLNQ